MSLYTHNFNLLPRPPRSSLSLGSESARARLPDVQNVAQLSEFVHRLVFWDVAYSVPSIYTQLKVGASITCVLIFLVMAICVRRMYERSFWIIRLMKRPSGVVIVVRR